jgi:hypothetical protein
MYIGKIGGGTGVIGGLAYTGTQFSIGPLLLGSVGLLVAGLLMVRMGYQKKRRRRTS